MAGDYAYSLLRSAKREPLVVIANSSNGAWVAELAPSKIPDPPIEFFSVREGVLGPVLHPAGLVLVRDDLLEALRDFSAEPFAHYRATIRPPQSGQGTDRYSVVKAPTSIPLASLTVPAGRAVLCVVSEAPGEALLVSRELRALLQDRGVPDLAFSEPLFAGGASAV